MDGVLFFDGGCGMCTRAVGNLRKLDRDGNLQVEPHQRPGTAERLGVPAERLAHSVWWLDSSGEVYAAAEAFNAALAVALRTRLPLTVYRLPGIRQLEEAVYRWVAAHRYRFPGTTPYCESDPAACSAR